MIKTEKIIELYPSSDGQFLFEPIVEKEPEEVIKVVHKKRPTYKQKWKEYDLAKTNQDILFKKILQELLYLAIPINKWPKKGRKPYSVADRIFSMCIKVYYRKDLRTTESILKELKNLDYIEKVPSFKSLDNFFNDKKLSNIIDDLILISALPLANLEHTGAIDSTGFSTSRFDRWFKHKWGKKEGRERVWRKAHAVCGCKTNVFLSVEVTKKNVGDAKVFEKVVSDKTKYFDMDKFTADKAYSSRKILSFLNKLNLTPFIPFKKNSRGTAKGSYIWRKMFTQFKYNEERFMEEYHKRSNIETSFHMVKQKFGDHLKTKSLKSNTNEIKIKFLCHNICVLIQEIYEQEIKIDFESCVKIHKNI